MPRHDCNDWTAPELKARERKARIIRDEASDAQHKAADPRASVFVSAHAGSGKTYLLVNRVIRLLLSGTPPQRILCINYTRAAAAEMRTRIFQRLAEWIHLDDDHLLESIRDRLGQADFSVDDLPRARRLFARALETPGGLRVFTIHGFCERLLQAFPVEAGLPPGFEVLEEAQAAELLARARTRLLTAPDALGEEMRQHLALLATFRHENDLSGLLFDLLRHRRLLRRMANDEDLKNAVYARLAASTGATQVPLDPDKWTHEWFRQLNRQEILGLLQRLDDAIATARKTGATDKTARECLAALAEAIGRDDADAAWDVARKWFATGDMSPRKTLLTKDFRQRLPHLANWLKEEQERFIDALQGYLARRLLAANVALYEAGMAILDLYEREKIRAGKFDYDDLVARTLDLLADDNLKASWVLYRLDGGIDHILLDEAQDTSPEQWEILERITEDFFAGDGADHPLPRTIFVVGDVKQSIYSFQGAAPEEFRRMRDFFQRRAKEARMTFREQPLEVSFRGAPEILEIVDEVIGQDDFDLGEDDIRKHTSARPHVRGLVELWPLEEAEKRREPDDPMAIWRAPEEITTTMRPQLRLATRIADTIAEWLGRGEALPPDALDGNKGADNGEVMPEPSPRPIRPRDILVLVQRRSGFMEPIISALKRRNIPVAGADRLKVSEHIAVRDLMALARFLLLPADDLSLAEVLKSPLLERDDGEPFTDDDLLRLRGELFDFDAPLERIDQIHDDRPLWRQLRRAAASGAPVKNAVRRLKRWRAMAGQVPPFELFGHVLWRDGGMWRFLRRLSHEATEPLEAFLDLALQHEQTAQPSLEDFIRWLERDAPEIKREQEGNADDDGPGEVRVMTVHGAKGLESPVVFLADTVRTPDRGKLGLVDIPLSDAPLPGEEAGQRLPLWPLSAAHRPRAVEELVRRALVDQEREYNRLLYVAMTRAADRLIVCGAESGNDGDNGEDGRKGKSSAPRIISWHERVARILQRDEYAVPLPDGRTIWRYPRDVPGCRASGADGEAPDASLPPWVLQPARPEPGPAEWIAPSRLMVPEGGGPDLPDDRAPTPEAPEPVLSPLAILRAGADSPSGNPFRRGQLIHKLLQYLPEVPAEQRERHALRWLRHAEPELDDRRAMNIWAEVKAVMEDSRFAALFGPRARAEVPFAARLDVPCELPAAPGTAPLLGGQIDRLVVTDTEVLVADFKTARPVPRDINEVPPSYIRQMALYRLAMRQAWPDRTVRCALLFTAGPTWLEIPAAMLDAATRDCHAVLRTGATAKR